MDRQIVFIGQIPLDTDILNTNLYAYIGLAKLSAAILGLTPILNGFTCTQTSPASMDVIVSSGEIYDLENIDNTAYGSLPSDTDHTIVKQGVNLDTTTLSCLAPSGVGNSVNYLVQIGFSEVDSGSVVLPYYNASDPSQAWSGPNNSGTPNYTIRPDTCNVTLKQGTQAPTGTQTTPSPDSGFLGAFVITIAHGATTIVNGNISTYSTTNFINETLTQKISQATADTRYGQISSIQNSQYTYGVDSSVSANTVTANLSPALTSYVAGQTVFIKIANTNNGASTINLNSLGAKSIKLTNGSAIASGDLISGMIAALTYDGTNFQIENPGTASYAALSIQNNSFTYAVDSGAANAYVCALTPAIASYSAGLGILLKVANSNTTASTINVNGLGTKNIKYVTGSSLLSGDLLAGGIAHLIYDGTQFQLLDPGTLITSNIKTVKEQVFSSTGAFTYTPSTGMQFCEIELQAGGGGSGGSGSGVNQSAAPGAGSGGGYLKLYATAAQIGASATGSVGVGGTAGSAGNNDGGNGGDTAITISSSTWTAGHGVGGHGIASSGSAQLSGASVTGGTNTTGSNATLLLNITGQSSGTGYSNGTNTIIVAGATGGGSHLGVGSFSNNQVVGNVGSNYGGGASGGVNGTGSNQTGAVGGQGIAIITEYCNQ